MPPNNGQHHAIRPGPCGRAGYGRNLRFQAVSRRPSALKAYNLFSRAVTQMCGWELGLNVHEAVKVCLDCSRGFFFVPSKLAL